MPPPVLGAVARIGAEANPATVRQVNATFLKFYVGYDPVGAGYSVISCV